MHDTNPPQSEPVQEEILTELRNLGQNLKELLQAAWESEERKKLKKEIETGLSDLADTLSQAVTEFSESPTGQTLKADIEDLQQRIRSGEVETKLRSELLSALRSANDGLKKASSSHQKSPEEDSTTDSPAD